MFHVIRKHSYNTCAPDFCVEKSFDNFADAVACASLLNKDVSKSESVSYEVCQTVSVCLK